MQANLRRNKISYIAVFLFAIIYLIIMTGGCSFTGGPRARLGYLPCATFGTPFPDPNNIGTHSYTLPFIERGGQLYTCRGGHIDLDHVRGNADNTRYLVKEIRKTLSKKGKGFSFTLTGETSSHKIRFTYPPNWDSWPDKDRIIDEIAFDTAPYIAFDATIWHEILTWFDVHFMVIEPEFNSAFSWEDIYSNLIGVKIGVESAKDTEHSYDESATIALKRWLKELGVRPADVAFEAAYSVSGDWYTPSAVPDMKMRNFDIGFDGYVTPVLIPDVNGCGGGPMVLPVPSLNTLQRYGLTMTHQIYPNVFEQGGIFKAANSKEIFPIKHYHVLIEHMKKEAAKKGYKYTY